MLRSFFGMGGCPMGQIRHGSATTTHAVRAAIMRACPPLVRGLARMIASFARAAKPGAGDHPEDGGEVAQARDGRRSQDRAEKASIYDPCRGRGGSGRRISASCAAPPGRRFAGLHALQPSIPHLTRSSLHRCLQRHGISRLPDVGGDKPKRAKFKRYPIGVRAFSRTNGVHALTPYRYRRGADR